MLRRIKELIYNKKGQTMVEYAILAAILVIVLLGAIGLLSGQIGSTFDRVTNALRGAR